MSFIEFHNLGIGFFSEQLVNGHILPELVLEALQMNWGEVKLWSQSLCILLVLVSEPHLREDRACYWYHEFRHLKSLSSISSSGYRKWLRVNFLSDTMEVSEDDSTLWEAEDTIEWALSLDNFDQVTHWLLMSKDHIWRFCFLLVRWKPRVELQPGFELFISVIHW